MEITCQDIALLLEEIAPVKLAENWDNTGFMLGSMKKSIKCILLCMDVTSMVAAEAAQKKADLVISHHPLLFKGLKRVVEDDWKGNIIYNLIRNDISVYSVHTNLDAAENGINLKLAEKLGLEGLENLKDTFIQKLDGKKYGLGKVGRLKRPMQLPDFINYVKTLLDTEYIRLVGSIEKPVEKVAVFCGSFDDDLTVLEGRNIDVLVAGDIKYHTAMDAREMGKCIIDAGHFNTERVILPELAVLIKDKFHDVKVFCSNMEDDPFKIY